jgi:hypothetical protein
MANATTPRITEFVGKEGYTVHVVGGTAAIPEGVMVAQLAADGKLVSGSTALSGPVIGVSTHSALANAEMAVETDRVYIFDNSATDPVAATVAIGAALFCEDNHTVAATSDSGSLQMAGTFMGMDGTKVRVKISPEHPAAATVAAEIDELQASAASADATMPIEFTAGILAAGTPMAAFADNASSNPGVTIVDSKAMGIRWNNNATQTAVFTRFVMPADIDTDEDAYLEFLVSKTGATAGDAVTMTVTLFNQVATALHDADDDYGGATNALVGNATAKTVSKLSRTLAKANLAAAGSSVTMSFKPTNGTLGVDDCILHGIQLKYTRKLLA